MPRPTSHRRQRTQCQSSHEYFHWNERVAGQDFVNETGAMLTLGYEHRWDHQRVRAELFGNGVDYHSDIDFGGGDVEALNSQTHYLGLRAEYEYLFCPETTPEISYFVGLGTRFWIRDLPDGQTDAGTPILGYQETWWATYPYIGLETNRDPTGRLQWYARGRVGVTAVTYEHADFIPANTVFPRPGVTCQFEGGLTGRRLFVGAYVEAFGWAASKPENGAYQPTSTMFTAGLKTGVMF
jgi:hypothetical protein